MKPSLRQAIARIRAGEPIDLSGLSRTDQAAANFIAAEMAFRNRDRRLHDALLDQIRPLPTNLAHLVELRIDFFEQNYSAYTTWLEQRDDLIRGANASGENQDFWLNETYYWLATLAWHAATNELGFHLFQKLYEQSRVVEDWVRAGSALANLASLALAEGDAAKGSLFQQRLEELHLETGEPIARIYALDLKAQLLATLGDADQAWKIFCSLEASKFSGFPGIYVFSVDYWVWLNLIRRGWMRQARDVEIRLQKWFHLHQLANYPEAIECTTIQKLLRNFEFQSLSTVLRTDPNELRPLLTLRSITLMAWLEICYRFGSDQFSALDVLLQDYKSWSGKAGLFRESNEIGLLKLKFREMGVAAISPAKIENQILLSIRNGFRLETKEMLLFKAEMLVKEKKYEEASLEIERARNLCVAFNYDFDALICERILSSRFGKHVSNPLSSINVETTEAREAADRLLNTWPWNEEAAASAGWTETAENAPEFQEVVNNSNSARVKALLELVWAANGQPVSIQIISQAVWGEEYNPLVHDNRVYQIVKEARRHLVKNGWASSSLDSCYGGGYCLLPINADRNLNSLTTTANKVRRSKK